MSKHDAALAAYQPTVPTHHPNRAEVAALWAGVPQSIASASDLAGITADDVAVGGVVVDTSTGIRYARVASGGDTSGSGISFANLSNRTAKTFEYYVSLGNGVRFIAGGLPYITEAGGTAGNKLVVSGVNPDGHADVRAFGAEGNNATDDSEAYGLAADFARTTGLCFYAPENLTPYLATGVNLRGVENVWHRGKIRLAVGEKVEIGDTAVSGLSLSIVLGEVTDGTSTNTAPAPSAPTLLIEGVKAGFIEIASTNFLKVDATGSGVDGSNAYLRVYVRKQIKRVLITVASTGSPYSNELHFYGGRCQELDVLGTAAYKLNRFIWHNPTFEGHNSFADAKIRINMEECSSCRLMNTRFDHITDATITFGQGAHSNVITEAYNPLGDIRGALVASSIPITDNSDGSNLVITAHQVEMNRTIVADIGGNSLVVANANSVAMPYVGVGGSAFYRDEANFEPSLAGLYVDEAFDPIFTTQLIPVTRGMGFGFYAGFEGDAMRAMVFIYDENQMPISSEGVDGDYIAYPGLTTLDPAGYYVHGDNQPEANLNQVGAIVRSEVKYIRLAVYAGTASLVSRVGAYVYTQPNALGLIVEGGAERVQNVPCLTGAPTQGYVPENFVVRDALGGTHINTFAHETATTASLTTGATVLNLGAVANTALVNVAIGDRCGILLDSGRTHWPAVTDVSGSDVTVSALPSDAASGARVVFNRWSSYVGISQQAAAADPAGGSTIDAESRTAIAQINAKLLAAGIYT